MYGQRRVEMTAYLVRTFFDVHLKGTTKGSGALTDAAFPRLWSWNRRQGEYLGVSTVRPAARRLSGAGDPGLFLSFWALGYRSGGMTTGSAPGH